MMTGQVPEYHPQIPINTVFEPGSGRKLPFLEGNLALVGQIPSDCSPPASPGLLRANRRALICGDDVGGRFHLAKLPQSRRFLELRFESRGLATH